MAFFRRARCDFGSLLELFNELVKDAPKGFSFRKLKRWYFGQALPTLDIVNLICNLTRQDLPQLGVTMKELNWGQRKGGYKKIVMHGCNLTMQDRIKGGRLTGQSNSVQHLKKIASVGGANSVKSVKHSNRRVIGPTGVKMFNRLERDAMLQITSAGLHAVYEPIIEIGDKRLIPDFQLGNTFIECTCDPKARVKAYKLSEKFKLLREHVPFRKGIVVTLPWLIDRYRQYLTEGVEVALVDDLLKRISLTNP
jgi:hypothetical protein